MQTQQLSAIMRLSWKIQHQKKYKRSKSLTAAWVIHQQADIIIFYLVKKHTPAQRTPETTIKNLTFLF